MKYKPVLNQNGVVLELIQIIFLALFVNLIWVPGNMGIFFIIAVIAGLIRLPVWLKCRRFESSPKETTQAKIVDRKVIESRSGKGGTSYTHYITYQFEHMADRRTFTFEEKVSKTLYNRVSIGMLLTVEYAIADPTLARRRFSNFKIRSLSSSSASRVQLDKQESPSYRIGETPVYPDTPEQEPDRVEETPVYPSASLPHPIERLSAWMANTVF